MKRFEKIPRELRQGRTKIVRYVTLDELLSNTITSQYSPTNLIAFFIELLLEEYVFLNEKGLFLETMGYPLEYPTQLRDGEFIGEFRAASERLEQEFRSRFCSNPPDGRIEWGKLYDFLSERIETN